MTREEAISKLSGNISFAIKAAEFEGALNENERKSALIAINVAIKALEQEPCSNCCNGDQIEQAKLCQKSYLAGMEHKQEPKWIPVSERLPEDRREVLVMAYWHETYQVMMASYFGDGLWWCVPFNNCGEHMQRLKPKAWMPLPDPLEEVDAE